MAIQLGATAIPPRTELEITDENERALKVYYDRGSVELVPHDRDPGDEQPPGSQSEIKPGADSAEGLNPASEGAGSPAPSAATDSAPDAQHEQQAGEQSPPSGEAAHAQIAEGIAQPESAPQQGPEPATDVSPAKADKPRARKGAN
ncbi:MAG: hypothetical protein ACPGJF_03345 [Sinimarinibacterium flocculans]|uniref:hypothetical protein n=1 Tax=Sinimarinibacterium flocculans TaxID=985250 RepID=UPI003C5B2B8D